MAVDGAKRVANSVRKICLTMAFRLSIPTSSDDLAFLLLRRNLHHSTFCGQDE
jgi:hypothetical protein